MATTKKTTSSTKPKTKGRKTNLEKYKRKELFSYSCIKKNYKIYDENKQNYRTKRMWIVIGDGHKRYRKFETQADAINYFRKLKKYAKMRIESVKSNDFIKTVYTFLEIEYRGIDVKELMKKNKPQKKSVADEEEFVDIFSEFDAVEEDDYKNIDLNEINKIIIEQEGEEMLATSEEIYEEVNTIEEIARMDGQISQEELDELHAAPVIIEEVVVEEPQPIEQVEETPEVVEEVVVEEPQQPQIEYAKYNPILTRKFEQPSKARTAYTFMKISIAILTAIICLLALWFSTIWQKNTLGSLGLKPNLADLGAISYDNIKSLGLAAWGSTSIINATMLDWMTTLSIVGLVGLIPVLLFKNGTLLSILSIIIVFAVMVVVGVFFFIAIFEQAPIVSLIKEFNAISDKDPVSRNKKLFEIYLLIK